MNVGSPWVVIPGNQGQPPLFWQTVKVNATLTIKPAPVPTFCQITGLPIR